MKSRTTGGYSSDSEQPSNSKQKKDDLSILRKPINTSLNGFLEAKRAYENGTDEIRRLLSRECDVIYECKECRNIFRSLTNFISHKRVYCRNLHSGFNGNGFIDISTIIQAEQEYANKKTGSTQSVATNTLSTGAITAKENKDLSSIIDRLIQREHENSIMDLTDFYDQVDKKLTKEQVLKRKHTLQLDRVPHSNVAVYQTLKSNYKHQGRDNMRNEVEEVHEMLASKNVLGPDGKILASSSKPKNLPFDLAEWEEDEDEEDDDDISCNICHSKFSTEKSLKLHIQAKHISSNLVYPCPSCQLTFLQPAAVYRHLSNFHNKTQRQIRQLRDSIQKRVLRADEVHFKVQNRELARLKTSNELKHKAENREWADILGKEIHSTPVCPFCSRKFERKAVLRSHMVSCPAQKKPSATISIDSNSSSNSSAAISPVVFENGDSKDSQGSTSSSSRRKKSRMPMKIINATCVMEDDNSKKKTIDLDDTIALNELFKNLGKEEMSLKTVNLDNLSQLSQSVEVKTEVVETEQEPLPPPLPKTPEPVKAVTPPPPPPAVVVAPVVAPKVSPVTVGIPPQTVIIPIQKPPTKIQKCYCKICKKKFDAVSNLKRHIAMYHYRKRKFGCKHCNFKGYRKYDVTNHLIAMHAMQHGTDLSEHMKTIEETFTREVTDDIVFMDDEAEPEIEKVVYKYYSKKEKVEKEKEQVQNNESTKIKEEEEEIDVKIEPDQENQAEVSISIPVITSTPKVPRSATNFPEIKDVPVTIKVEKNEARQMVPPPTIAKRPIRNRVKPVNKDFVYDMSGLIKNDSGYGSEKESTPVRASRRRNTVSLSNDIPPPFTYQVSSSPTKKAVPPPPPPPILPSFDYEIHNKEEIRGITQKFALGLVAQNLAAYGSMPEIPEEKQFCLAGKFLPPSHRQPRVEQSPYSSSDDDALVKRMGVKKRRLDLFQNSMAAAESITLNTIFKSNEENMASPPSPALIPEVKTPPPTPTKRISLLQRYNESKAKKLQESLLRSALEN